MKRLAVHFEKAFGFPLWDLPMDWESVTENLDPETGLVWASRAGLKSRFRTQGEILGIGRKDGGFALSCPEAYAWVGFWGHGVNSSCFQFVRCDATLRICLRVGYGGLHGNVQPAGSKISAYLRAFIAFERKVRDSGDYLVAIETMGVGRYQVERPDGTSVRAWHSFLDDPSFAAGLRIPGGDRRRWPGGPDALLEWGDAAGCRQWFALWNGDPGPGEAVSIGAGPLNAVWLEGDRRGASWHASIESEGDGFVLEDCGSEPGTLVNGDPVTRHRLRSGDVISVGETAFCWVVPVEPDLERQDPVPVASGQERSLEFFCRACGTGISAFCDWVFDQEPHWKLVCESCGEVAMYPADAISGLGCLPGSFSFCGQCSLVMQVGARHCVRCGGRPGRLNLAALSLAASVGEALGLRPEALFDLAAAFLRRRELAGAEVLDGRSPAEEFQAKLAALLNK